MRLTEGPHAPCVEEIMRLAKRLEKCERALKAREADYQALWDKLRKTEVLAEYADHSVPCPRTHGDGTKCTCGYETARSALEGPAFTYPSGTKVPLRGPVVNVPKPEGK